MKNYTYLDLIEALGIGGAHPGGTNLTQLILNKEKINHHMTVLDAGCGTGQTSAFLFKKFHCHVHSLDINKALLKKAKKRFKYLNIPINVVHGDIQSLPFQPFTFDYVISESVLPFTNIEKSVSEFSRVLKDRGFLLANEMTIDGFLTLEQKQALKQFYGFTDFLTENMWINLFKRHGFITKEILHPRDFLDLNNETELDLSSEISEEIFQILDKHEYFMNVYKNILSYRIYKLRKAVF